jgi:hypothetical protein
VLLTLVLVGGGWNVDVSNQNRHLVSLISTDRLADQCHLFTEGSRSEPIKINRLLPLKILISEEVRVDDWPRE